MDRQQHDGGTSEGIGPFARERARLVPMSRLQSWTVVEGDPDIRGWEVRTIGGRPLGAVGDLLIDGAVGEVVLLDIDLPASDRRTFVPVRVVHLDVARHVIVMDSADLPETDSPRAGRSDTPSPPAVGTGTIHLPLRERTVARHVAPAPADLPPARSAGEATSPRGSWEGRESQRIERLSTEF